MCRLRSRKKQYVQRCHAGNDVALGGYAHILGTLAALLFTLMTNQHEKSKHAAVFAPFLRVR